MNIELVIGENRIKIDVKDEETLSEAIRRAGEERGQKSVIDMPCGGKGRCGKCRVRLIRGGNVSGNRGIPVRDLLACQTTGAQLLQIWIRERFDTVVLLNRPVEIQDERKREICLPEDVIWDEPQDGGSERETRYGVAFDIGTTTVAAMLWKLDEREDRTPVAVVSAANPQIVYGADVISRIEYAGGSPERVSEMQRLLVEQMNGMIGQLKTGARRTGSSGGTANELDSLSIARIAAVGNPTMMHFLFGRDPSGLARTPFRGEVLPLEIDAGTLGLGPKKDQGWSLLKGTKLRTLPVMGGHLGADAAAVLLAKRIPEIQETTLAIDIGTNGELILTDGRGNLWGCSAAAGPAFEGGNISCGMRGEPGAVEAAAVREDGRGMAYRVIGSQRWIRAGEPVDTEVRGICGSGLIDMAAVLLELGWMDGEGRRKDPADIVLTPDVVLTQRDIRQLQTAKGAIGAGIQILLTKLLENSAGGCGAASLKRIILAGAFGSYIRPESAVKIGLLPKGPRIEAGGNLAGVGASLILLSDAEWKRGCDWAGELYHVELADQEGFAEAFLTNMYFL